MWGKEECRQSFKRRFQREYLGLSGTIKCSVGGFCDKMNGASGYIEMEGEEEFLLPSASEKTVVIRRSLFRE